MAVGPCEVWFYHLERSSLEQVLPELLEKTLSRGWKAVIRARQPERVEQLDSWLWSYKDDSFLPHAPSDEPGAPRQPVLLTIGSENPNGADALFLIDGADPDDLEGYSRCIVIFDGQDETQLAVARSQWTALKGRGHPASYWHQQARGWEKQA